MRNLVIAISWLCLSFADVHTHLVSQQARPAMVAMFDDQGVGRISFEVRDQPYAEGMRAVASYNLWDHQDVKDADGLAVTGLAFYAWSKNSKVSVEVFSLVPSKGAPNRYLAKQGDDTANLVRQKEIGTLSLSPGQSVALDQMKAWGLKPYTVRLR